MDRRTKSLPEIEGLPADRYLEIQDQLGGDLADQGVDFEGRRFPASLSPVVMDRKLDATMRAGILALHRILVRVAESYRVDPEIRDFFAAYRPAERWLTQGPDDGADVFVCRLDGVPAGDSFHVTETNTSCPGGVIHNGVVNRQWFATVQKHFDSISEAQYDLSPQTRHQDLFVTKMIAEHVRRTGNPPQAAAVVNFNGKYRNETDWIVAGLQSHGVPTQVADASQFTVSDSGALQIDGQVIDLVYNKLDSVELIRSPAAETYLDGSCRTAAPTTSLNRLIASVVLNDKSVLALLTDPVLIDRFSAEEQRTIRAHVPWTRRLVPGKTDDPDGASIDLMDFVSRGRDRLVLKPAHGTRGRGVVVGPAVTDQEWREAVTSAATGGPRYVVQQYLPLPTLSVPAHGGETHLMSYGIDTHVLAGEFAGYQCRASLDPVINIGKRGMMVPVLVSR